MSVMIEDKPLTKESAAFILRLLGNAQGQFAIANAVDIISVTLSLQRIVTGKDFVLTEEGSEAE